MTQKRRLLQNLPLMFVLVGLVACGGPKETVKYEPDPFPQPVITEQEPIQPVEEKVAVDEFVDVAPKPDLILQTVNFEFDKSTLSAATRAILSQNARILQEYPEIDVRIEGHCDERGTVEYNLALGERRAMAVRDYLVNFGVAPISLSVISYGKERPIDTRHTPSGWDQNRRAEFVILNQ